MLSVAKGKTYLTRQTKLLKTGRFTQAITKKSNTKNGNCTKDDTGNNANSNQSYQSSNSGCKTKNLPGQQCQTNTENA